MLKILRNILLFVGVIAFMFLMGIASLMRPDTPVDRLMEAYTGANSRFLEVDGMRVHYSVEGVGEPLLLLHGTFASLHTWEDWAGLMRNDFQIIRVDLPGFGITGPQPDNDYSTAASLYMLEALREELGLERWSIAGNSLGGGIALSYARHYAQHTDRLVLLNAAAGRLPEVRQETPASDTTSAVETPASDTTSAVETPASDTTTSTESLSRNSSERPFILRALDHPRIRSTLTVLTPRAVIQQALREVYADEERIRPEVVQRYFDLLRREGNRQAFMNRNAGATGDRSHVPVLPEPLAFHELPHPILILWGEQDRWIRVALGRRLHEALPGSRLIVYPDAGHVPMEEIPHITAADVMQFLQNE